MTFPAHLNVHFLLNIMGHTGLQRLYFHGVTRDLDADRVVMRVDPVSGGIELFWWVDNHCTQMTVAGDRVMFTDFHSVIEYNLDGTPRRITDLRKDYLIPHRSCLRPDSTITAPVSGVVVHFYLPFRSS